MDYAELELLRTLRKREAVSRVPATVALRLSSELRVELAGVTSRTLGIQESMVALSKRSVK